MAKKGGGKRKSGRGHKVRVDIRRNKQTRARDQNLTHDLMSDDVAAEDAESTERLSGKGAISRRRTVVGVETDGDQLIRSIDAEGCLEGRVISFIGLNCRVQAVDDGRHYECTIRGMLRTLARDSRSVVVTGDRVLFRPSGDDDQGVVERVEPRHGVISRNSQGREHILVSNIDQILIVASAADPDLKPNLIDRYLIMAERHGVDAIVCINKADLLDITYLEQIAAVYGRLGYPVILTSAVDGRGIDQLRSYLQNRQTAVSGQSGVGKSSLLNVVDSQLNLDTSDVSDSNAKGRHTTRRARLLPMKNGGWVADTPGIRQFELWDITLEEVDGYFIEFRPFVPYCRFPNCSHTHEETCGVKDAVTADLIDQRRYDSYLRIREQNIFVWKNPARGQT
ncbi:MAG TPA: ribosome small subunit-dependent GTPase A [Planctomycetes bacterium]|nr:ribosome small subunit-dependent GTPase A [Planctomycetota bacterium]